MIGFPQRLRLGFVAAVISVLLFHQGAWAILHQMDVPQLGMPNPFPVDRVPPFGIPRIISLCFWGGLWGAAFGTAWRGSKGSYLFGGFWLGVIAVLVSFFVVAPLKGLPIAGGGDLINWIRALLINCSWGVGVAIVLPVLLGEAEMKREATVT